MKKIITVLILLLVPGVSFGASTLSIQEILNNCRVDGTGTAITVRESAQEALNAIYDSSNNALRIQSAGYKTIFIPASALIVRTTDPAAYGQTEKATNDVMYSYYAFDGGATEEHAQVSFVMPENWDRDTIKIKAVWSSASGSTTGDTAELGFRGAAISNNDALDTSWGTAVTVSDALLADDGADLQITAATGAMTIGGTPALADLIVIDVYRNTDGTDDMAEDLWLFGFWIQYYADQTPAGW